jgi:hypothetical protein
MDNVKPRPALEQLWWIVAAALITVGFWFWVFHILAPANAAVIVAAHRPIGNNSDLYPRWLGARELLLHGRDPYSAEVTREIQIGFYGRPLNSSNPSDPTAQESFVYPIYVAFLLAPTIHLPFPVVAIVFRWILLASIAATIPLWMYCIGLRARWPMVAAGMLLAASTSPAMYEYFQQNLAALAVLFLAAAFAATVAGKLGLAGVLLALSTIKPDTTGALVIWLLLWAAASIKRRGRILWSFIGTLSLLTLAAEIYSPHWIQRFLLAVRQYPAYGTDPSVIQVLFPRPVAAVVTVGLVAYLLVRVWSWKNAAAGSQEFAWALALVGATTLVTLPKLAGYNALLLIPGLLVLVVHYARLPAGRILTRGIAKAAFACQLWQWLAAVALALASFVLPATRIRSAAHIPDYTFIPLWPITLIALIAVSTKAARNVTAHENIRVFKIHR